MSERPHDIARAFVASVRDSDATLRAVHALQPIAHALAADATVRAFFDAQDISAARKEKAIHDAWGSALTHEAQQLVRVLLAHDALREIGDVCAAIQEESDRQRGIARVTVTSAVQMTPDVRLRVEQALTQACGRTVQAEYVIQPSYIGGFAVTIDGSRAWDGTVRGRLDRLRAKLASV